MERPSIAMTDEQLEKLLREARQAAANAACAIIQSAFGQTDGGLAAQYFSGIDAPGFDFNATLLNYAIAEERNRMEG